MKKFINAHFVILFALSFVFPLDVQAQGSNPVVVELFTSQSCSSCPPADKILLDLAQNSNVIALGCHVTYWDHLSWKDTVSRQECTQLQRTIAQTNGSSRVYTPQMVVNGGDEFVGSSKSKAQSAIEKTSDVKPLNPVLDGDFITVKIPDGLGAGLNNLTLMVYGYGDKIIQDIKSGENGGLTQTYINPVQYILSVNVGKDSAAKLGLNGHKAFGHVVILREGMGGKILAAGVLR